VWANLHAFEHNNLGRITLTPPPKYGQTLIRSWAPKNIARNKGAIRTKAALPVRTGPFQSLSLPYPSYGSRGMILD
jgi:hypothetical protein